MCAYTNPGPLELLLAAIEGDPAQQVQVLLDYVKHQPVVELRQVRRLERTLKNIKSDDLITSLASELGMLSNFFFLYYGEKLLDMIALYRPPGARPTDASVRRAAREVAANPYFRKLNQRARRYFADFAEVPYGEVQDHYREGYRVSGHLRFFGNHHLLDLPFRSYPEFVGRVIHVLATNRQYKVWPEGKLDSNWHRRYWP